MLENSLVSSLCPGWMVVPVPTAGNTDRGPGLDGQGLFIHMWNIQVSKLVYKEKKDNW